MRLLERARRIRPPRLQVGPSNIALAHRSMRIAVFRIGVNRLSQVFDGLFAAILRQFLLAGCKLPARGFRNSQLPNGPDFGSSDIALFWQKLNEGKPLARQIDILVHRFITRRIDNKRVAAGSDVRELEPAFARRRLANRRAKLLQADPDHRRRIAVRLYSDYSSGFSQSFAPEPQVQPAKETNRNSQLQGHQGHRRTHHLLLSSVVRPGNMTGCRGPHKYITDPDHVNCDQYR